jgi:hypothetical protein
MGKFKKSLIVISVSLSSYCLLVILLIVKNGIGMKRYIIKTLKEIWNPIIVK